MIRYILYVALCCLCILIPGLGRAFSLWPFGHSGIDYDILIEGIHTTSQREALHKVAEEAVPKETPPQNKAELSAYSAIMQQRVEALLQSEGYYSPSVTVDIKTPKETDNTDIVIHIIPGAIYTVSGTRVMWQDMPERKSISALNPDEYLIKEGEPASAPMMLLTADAFRRKIADNGCFLSLDVKPSVLPDHETETALVHYTVKSGAEVNFGELDIVGLDKTKEDVIHRYVQWEKGECFSAAKVKETETALLKSRLFSVARIDIKADPDTPWRSLMILTVNERKPRTLSAGVNFATDTGFGVKGGWEHRNFRGLAHRAHANISVSQLGYALDGGYAIPFFRGTKQTLNLNGSVIREITDSYESSGINLLGSIERKITSYFKSGLGVGLRYSEILQDGDTEGFFLFYVPAYIDYDTRDSTLDPKQGIAARLNIAPYADLSGLGEGFVKSHAEIKTYVTAEQWMFRPTLALKATGGIISGASINDVPADTRFTAGGGGSVRGYAFQAIGPRTSANEPLGGINLIEMASEVRLRFTDTIGAALFFEGASLSDNAVPFSELDMFWGAGAGLRYYSPLGPFRIDVGVPLKDIEGESSFQVYVSLGQAF